MNVVFARDERTGFEVELLCQEAFETYWPDISRMMDRLPETLGHLTKEFIHEAGSLGHFQFWSAGSSKEVKAIFTTHIITFPLGRVLQIVWASGEGVLSEGVPTTEAAMQKFATDNDCDSIEIVGRPGWEKLFAPYGFKRIAIVLSCRVTKNERMN